MGKSTISMAIFNSKLLNYQRVPGRLAGPGLRGGLLGHATPGGELAGAEATAGGGEVGRNSHAGAMAGRMGVGWCLGLGLVVGEGNINGNIWKYLGGHLWIYELFVGNCVVAQWCMDLHIEDGEWRRWGICSVLVLMSLGHQLVETFWVDGREPFVHTCADHLLFVAINLSLHCSQLILNLMCNTKYVPYFSKLFLTCSIYVMFSCSLRLGAHVVTPKWISTWHAKLQLTAAQVFANKQDSRAGFGHHMKPCFVDSFDSWWSSFSPWLLQHIICSQIVHILSIQHFALLFFVSVCFLLNIDFCRCWQQRWQQRARRRTHANRLIDQSWESLGKFSSSMQQPTSKSW